MDVYYIRSGAGWSTYCTDCASDFCNKGVDENDVDGPYPNGGGETDLIRHCDSGQYCVKAMQTSDGPVGACLHNDLTLEGINYTIDTLSDYVDNKNGIPEVLDVWAEELQSYSLTSSSDDVLREYCDVRAIVSKTPDNQLLSPKSKKKRDTKVSSMIAFFGGRPVSEGICCKSCKDTGVIMLFNRSVKCTDCSKSRWAEYTYDANAPL